MKNSCRPLVTLMAMTAAAILLTGWAEARSRDPAAMEQVQRTISTDMNGEKLNTGTERIRIAEYRTKQKQSAVKRFKRTSGGTCINSTGTFPCPSDILLKRDVALVQYLPSGFGLYRFRYNWSDQVYVGVIAQEVAKVAPDAVTSDEDGYLRVDYARLGLKLMTWDQWVRSTTQREH